MVVPATRRGGLATFLAIAMAVLLVVGAAPQRAQAATTMRQRMLALTNHARETRDRKDLNLNVKLSRLAKKHSRDMMDAGYLFHTDVDVLKKALAPYDWSVGGENIGVGSSLSDVQSAFMGSKEHRKNILLKAYDHAAIGVVRSDGKVWVTVIFYG